MARSVLFLLCISLAFAGCSCDSDKPGPKVDAGPDSSIDSGLPDGSNMDTGTTDAMADAGPTDDDDAGYDAGPGPRNACGGEMCDLLSATSCTTAGDSCLFLIDDPNPVPFAQCQPVGTAAEGEVCDSAYDCAPGLDCTVEGGGGVCRQYCCNVNQKSGCPGDQACVLEFLDDSDRPTGVGLCNSCDDCNPLDSAGSCGVGAGVGCYPIPGNDGRTFSDCTLCLPSTMGLDVGERCRSVNDCSAGAGCFRINNAPPSCVQMCDLQAATDPCPGAATCQNRLGAASQNDTIGLCIE